MDRTPVTSTDLASIGYDADSSTLEVEFCKGGVYQYFGVPADIFDSLMAAASKGSYFNQTVKKGGYSYSRVG